MLPLIDAAISRLHSTALQIVAQLLVFSAGLLLLERSADAFIDAAALVSRRLGVPDVLVGLLTAGAEWEELAVVTAALSQQHPHLALGNVFGSCIANILGSFSLGLLFHPERLPPPDQSARIYAILLFLLSMGVSVLGWTHQLHGRAVGGGLVGIFVVYVGAIAWGIRKGVMEAPGDSDSEDSSSSEGEEDQDQDVDPSATHTTSTTPLLARPRTRPSSLRPLLTLLLSVPLLALSGLLLSSSCASIASLLHLSDSLIGLTLLAVATTLPEKLIAVYAGTRGATGVLVANTVGSNVFLLTLVLGIVLLHPAAPAGLDELGAVDLAVVLGSAAVLAVVVSLGAWKRWIGVGMLLAYVGYLVSVFVR